MQDTPAGLGLGLGLSHPIPNPTPARGCHRVNWPALGQPERPSGGASVCGRRLIKLHPHKEPGTTTIQFHKFPCQTTPTISGSRLDITKQMLNAKRGSRVNKLSPAHPLNSPTSQLPPSPCTPCRGVKSQNEWSIYET